MAGPDPDDAPIAEAAGAAGERATEAFKILGNETRLAILVALWEAHEPHAESNAVPFTELRERVGLRQGAQFNYHLDKLVGRFVAKTDVGYELRRTGLALVQSIVAGTGIEEPTLEPTEVDDACEFCGAPVAITYARNYVYRLCTECDGFGDSGGRHPEGALSGWTFEPTGLVGRTAEEAYAASTVKTFSRIALRFEGICPDCSGRIEWDLDVCEDHEPDENGRCADCGRKRPVLARESCTVCKSAGEGPPGIKTLFHPAVVSFFHERGVDVGFTGDTGFEEVVRTMELVHGFEEAVVSTDPLRVRVTFTCEGDELRLLLDGDVTVVAVERD